MELIFLVKSSTKTDNCVTSIIIASLKSEPMGKLISRIPGPRLYFFSLFIYIHYLMRVKHIQLM